MTEIGHDHSPNTPDTHTAAILANQKYGETHLLSSVIGNQILTDQEDLVTSGKDILTGLDNRSTWKEKSIQLIKQFERLDGDDNYLMITMIDFDDFKKINDTYGHLAGDTVLRESSLRLQKIFRSTDIIGRYGMDTTIGRYGGDEIVQVGLCGHTTTDNILSRFKDTHHQLTQEPIHIVDNLQQPSTLTATQSWGLSVFTLKDIDTIAATAGLNKSDADYHDKLLSELVREADTALYAAKAAGKNCLKSSLDAISDLPASAKSL